MKSVNQIDVESSTAYVAGYRSNSVRLRLRDGTDVGFCTFTYSFSIPLYLQQHYAKEFVRCFNAARGGNQ